MALAAHGIENFANLLYKERFRGETKLSLDDLGEMRFIEGHTGSPLDAFPALPFRLISALALCDKIQAAFRSPPLSPHWRLLLTCLLSRCERMRNAHERFASPGRSR